MSSRRVPDTWPFLGNGEIATVVVRKDLETSSHADVAFKVAVVIRRFLSLSVVISRYLSPLLSSIPEENVTTPLL